MALDWLMWAVICELFSVHIHFNFNTNIQATMIHDFRNYDSGRTQASASSLLKRLYFDG